MAIHALILSVPEQQKVFGAVELFADGNFTGRRTTIFLSEWESGKVHSFRNWGMNNTCSSLRWKSLGDRQTVTLYDAEEGNGIAYNNSNSQTVTVETSDQHVAGISSTFSQMFSAGAEGIATSSTQWSVSVIHSYTRTDTSSRSQTKIVNLNITLTVNAPPKTRYKATLLVTIGQLPATEYIMTA
ncbi:hypothetical protein EAE99_005384 [Botrytis elliptica]|nr:hypothetical protein EAE99_005384 [Botrytis elliptica]